VDYALCQHARADRLPPADARGPTACHQQTRAGRPPAVWVYMLVSFFDCQSATDCCGPVGPDLMALFPTACSAWTCMLAHRDVRAAWVSVVVAVASAFTLRQDRRRELLVGPCRILGPGVLRMRCRTKAPSIIIAKSR
jgi:hypothetical protein